MPEFKVSVVIPVYNAVAFLKDAVSSVLSLDHVAEIILVEDGSKDDSLRVCQELAAAHPKVRLEVHDNHANMGAAESRNLGVRIATQDFIAFLDADDVYLPNRFDKVSRILVSQPDVDGVYECVQYLNESRRYTVQKNINPKQLFHYLLRGTYGHFHTNAITVRRSLFGRVGYFNKDLLLHQDTEMWLRMAHAGRLIAGEIGEPVAMIRRHEGNRIWKGKSAETELKAYLSLRTWLKDKPVSLVNKILLNRKIARFRSLIEDRNPYFLLIREMLSTPV